MTGLHPITAIAFAVAVLALTVLAAAARRSRSRWLDEPTERLPILGNDVHAFDEIARLERGDPDPDLAALARGPHQT
jgi:HAMP domain-containing protein